MNYATLIALARALNWVSSIFQRLAHACALAASESLGPPALAEGSYEPSPEEIARAEECTAVYRSLRILPDDRAVSLELPDDWRAIVALRLGDEPGVERGLVLGPNGFRDATEPTCSHVDAGTLKLQSNGRPFITIRAERRERAT